MQAPPKYTPTETARRAEEWYNTELRQQLETEENLGKILAIDVDTGDYFVSHDMLMAANELRKRKADADMFFFRIGYPAVHKIGGALKPYERFRK
jgi:hypothetical protein